MAKLTKFSLGQSYGDLVEKLNETIDAVGEVQDNPYTLPAATSTELGGVKVGSNITNSSGTISLTKGNVTSALGYTPPTTNTTYSVATTSADGLMSKTDKTRLDTLASYLTNNHDDYVDSLAEIMEIFDTYPQGASVVQALSGKVDKVSGKGLSANDFTAAYKTKLDGIDANANNYSLPTASSSILGGVKTGSNITNTSGTISLTKGNVTDALGYTPPNGSFVPLSGGTMTGTLGMAAKKNSLYWASASGSQGYYAFTQYKDNGDEGLVFGTGNNKVSFTFRNDGNTGWNDTGAALQIKNNTVAVNQTITGSAASYNLDVNGTANAATLYEGGTSLANKYQAKGTYAGTSVATQNANGLMSSTDKTKVDNAVTVGDSQTISGNKTFTGQQTFTSDKFSLYVAGDNRNDSWFKFTDDGSTYYAFGIRRPYDSYGFQIKKHTTSGDSYYDIYHQGNYTKMPAATTGVAGLMSAADKAKLDGIASGANAYSLPTASSSALGGVKVGSNITNTSGTISLTKTNVTSALGYTPPTQDTTYSAATTTTAGLMSAQDKTHLNTLVSYLTNYHDDYVDSITELLEIFDNYPQGSNVLEILSGKVDKVSGKGLSTNDFTAAYKTKLDGIATGANNYSLPAATSSALGGVKIGSNITNSSGTISLTKANVTSALGYTPPTTNTTYSEATTSAAGLMSAADKTKVNNAVTLSDDQTISGTKTFSSHIKTAENVMGTKYRTHTNYETGVVYGTSGNEALTFAIQNPVTAFQIAYGTKPSEYASGTWQSVTPLFQTKDGKVIINRKIASSTDSANLKLFDVNGDANATTLYENGTALSSKYASKAVATQASNGLMSAQDKQKLDGISSTAGSGGGFAYFATANILSDIYGFNKTYLAFGSTSSSGTNWRMAVIKTTNADEYGTGVPDLFITTSNSTSASHHYYSDGDGRYEGSVAGFGYCYIFVVQ